jgi:hypothetical protein
MSFEKRQREIQQKLKAQAKRQKRLERKLSKRQDNGRAECTNTAS